LRVITRDNVTTRIAHIVAVYPPYRGGMARVAEEYAVRLRARGHLVDVLTSRKGRVAGDPAFVQRLNGLQIGNAAIVPHLFFRLREYDLVHLHYPYFGGAEFALARRLWNPNQPLVLTYQMDATASGLRGFVFDTYRRVVLPTAVRLADRILISSSDYFESSALARVPGAAERTEIHPLGVDLQRFHAGEERDLRVRIGAGPEETVLIFVGTLDAAHHFKGLRLLLHALSTLQHFAWRLVVVGDGPLRPDFEELVRTCQIHSRVVFAGDVSDQALPKYYRAADVHVFPSTGRSEAYGLVVLEAAASGIPSVVAALPGVRTVVRAGETGWHVAPGDAIALRQVIEKVVRDPDQRRDFGRRARRHAETEYAWDSLIDRLEATYDTVLARRRPA
jgi:glycosyltransferase involved in cell wall biosynthesis